MKSFWIRMINLLVIVGVVLCYNLMITIRSKEDEIARLDDELKQTQAKWENDKNKIPENIGEGQTGKEQADEAYQDGSYTGQAEGFGDLISIEVKIENGRISNIAILEAEGEDEAYLSMAKSIITDIMEKQSVQVDTVSGATFSSAGIKKAVDDALRKAGK